MLWAQDRKGPPIAKINEIMRSRDSMIGEVEFDQKDPFAMLIFNKYAKGFLSAWSISFDPDRKALEPIMDSEGQITGYHFKEAELLELSAVPIPANAEALVREFEGEDPALARRFAKGLEDEELRSALEKVFTRADHTSKAAETEPNWGSVDKASLPEVAFAWEAPGTDGEKKSTWKYPHHWVQNPGNKNEDGIWTTGSFYLHEGGLRAAWAAAMGARSGERAPASVINHLQKHRRALGVQEQERGKFFSLCFGEEGRKLLREKSFEEVEGSYSIEDLLEEAEETLAPGVFKKSLEERGDKIPTVYRSGDVFEVTFDFEAIQVSDGVVKEAKIIRVEVSLPNPAEKAESIPPEEPDPATKKGEEEATDQITEEVEEDVALEELEVEMMAYSARIAEL